MDDTAVFRVRRTFRRAGIFLGVFGLFIPAGVLMLLFAEEKGAGLALIGFGASVVLLMLLSILSPGSRYRVDGQGLLLKKGLSTCRIAFSDITGLRVLDETEANAVVREYMTPAMASEAGLDLKGWVRSNKKYSDFVRYCTVPIILSKITSGNTLNIVKFWGRTSGDFLILRETSGAERLLSPVDPAALQEALALRIRPGADLRAPYPYRSEQTSLAGGRPVSHRRKILIINLITAAVILAAVAVYLTTRSPAAAVAENPAAPEGGEAASGQIGWLDADSFRARVERPLLATVIEDPEQRKTFLREALAASCHFDLVDGMTCDYYLRFGLDPQGAARERVWNAVANYLFTLQQLTISEEFDPDVTAVSALIEIRCPGLRESVDGLIAGALAAQP